MAFALAVISPWRASADEDTLTATPTHTATPSSTPTPRSGCQYLEYTPIAVYSTYAEGTGSGESMVAGSCMSDAGDDTVIAQYRALQGSEGLLTYGSNIIMEWDTESFPSNLMFTDAVLRVNVISATSSGGADDVHLPWLNGGGCSAADYQFSQPGGASNLGSCSANCLLHNLTPGDRDFALDGSIALQLNSKRIRMTVAPDLGPSLESNSLRIANGHGSLPGPDNRP